MFYSLICLPQSSSTGAYPSASALASTKFTAGASSPNRYLAEQATPGHSLITVMLSGMITRPGRNKLLVMNVDSLNDFQCVPSNWLADIGEYKPG